VPCPPQDNPRSKVEGQTCAEDPPDCGLDQVTAEPPSDPRPDSGQNEKMDAFLQQDFLHLPGAVPKEIASTLLELLWEEYAQKHGVSRDDPESWKTKRGGDVRIYAPPSQELAESPSFTALTTLVTNTMNELFENESWALRGATIFVNCPVPNQKWVVPSGWHTDMPIKPNQQLPSTLYIFAFLDHAMPQGGNTFLLAGSTRRAMLSIGDKEMRKPNFVFGGNKDLQEMLARENEWFSDLFFPERSSLSDEERAQWIVGKSASSAGISMNMVELLGAPGDLMLWDPRSLHSASINVSSRPRSLIRFKFERAK